MLLFSFEAYRPMAEALLRSTGLMMGRFQVARFENGELHLEVQTPVAREDCLILGSIAPPDEQLLCALLLAHTIKKEGARRVAAVFPYLAYARHDKDKPGESLATAWTGALARASGLDHVITIDVHSEGARRLFPISVVSLSPAEVFAEALKRTGLGAATIVSPDEGAIGRCEAVRAAAGMAPGKIPYFEKHRTPAGIAHSGPIGEVGRQAVIIDDILDTGGTLISACEKLSDSGVADISVMVTHGLFTGDRWGKLWQLGVRRIFCTDSVPLAATVNDERIVRLSVGPLLEKELCVLAKV